MVENKKARFLVVGMGMVGGCFSACLSARGHSVTGVDVWAEHIDAIRQDGLSVAGSVSVMSRLTAVHTSLAAVKDKSFDYVVIAVKASFLEEVAEQLEFLEGDFKIVSMQNGIDTEEFLGERFGRERTMRIVVNFAGRVDAPGKLRMFWFNKPNYVGCLCSGAKCGHAHELADIMTDAGLDAQATRDIKKSIWRKAILNCALTPVCSLLDMTMADVMTCRDTFHVVELTLGECLKVARARGYDYGEGFLDSCLDYLSRGGAHKPSMLQDLKNGLPTEIDFLNGKIVSHGIRLGVPVPVNTTLVAMVKAKEGAVIKERLEKTEGRTS